MEPVRSEARGAVRVLTLCRPKVLNALDTAVLRSLEECFREVESAADVRALVLTGEGRAFAAGADIAEMRACDAAAAEALSRFGHGVMDLLESLPVPTIAAVNGFALGGGCELALACDWIYASEQARFGQPEVNLGVIPGFGGTARLLRRVGPAWAREIVLGGEPVDAATALRIGLVNRTFPAAELLDAAVRAGETIARKGPLAVAAAKRVLLDAADGDARSAHALEQATFGVVSGSEDRNEGMDAFLEKRDPVFRGR